MILYSIGYGVAMVASSKTERGPRERLGESAALPDRVALMLRDRILSGELARARSCAWIGSARSSA